tara:strand:+ start:757 stop:879 length:123 start_codon:yes stop_codon:yes gene_type:complete
MPELTEDDMPMIQGYLILKPFSSQQLDLSVSIPLNHSVFF